jgi:DNA-binding transcriptional regulator GbsR (MarR family)
MHALLYLSEQPLTAEDIADKLDIIRSIAVLGDRRTFYVAETDLWTLVRRIAAGRKARELDPAATALRHCLETARSDRAVSPVAARRLQEMLDFVERTGTWYEQMIKLPRSQIATLMKLGGGIVRLLDRAGLKRRAERAAAR